MKNKILVDMDAILADLLHDWLARYNEEFGTNLTKADIIDWDYGSKYIPKKNQHFYFNILAQPGFIRNLPVIPGAKDAMRRLHELPDTEIYICTAAVAATFTITEKLEWIEEHFPYINRRNFIAAYNKEMVKANVLIDDAPKNIHAYRSAWPDSLIYAIQYPYNSDPRVERNAIVVPDYADTEVAWNGIVEDIYFRFVKFPKAVGF